MTARTTTARAWHSSQLVARMRFWWHASTEIHELTRDHDLEERVIAEAATRLSPGPWNIAWLFRRREVHSTDWPATASGRRL